SSSFSFFIPAFPPYPLLPSFPTRRSSDLAMCLRSVILSPFSSSVMTTSFALDSMSDDRYRASFRGSRCARTLERAFDRVRQTARSEEHTSELQSLAYLVCRLLLEKKNN